MIFAQRLYAATSAKRSMFLVLTLLSISWSDPCRGAGIDLITGGPSKASSTLVIDGVSLGLSGAFALGGVILDRPWVFMFADCTPAPQDFEADVGPAGGFACDTAASNGFFGSAASSATAGGAGGILAPVASTSGLASANALAGIGTTLMSAVPGSTALSMHIATIVVDPLLAPDSPTAQSAPRDPATFVAFDPTFVPAVAVLNAYMLNEVGDTESIFRLEASLSYNAMTGTWDELQLSVTGPGGSPSSLVTPADFSFFSTPSGMGYCLNDVTLTIPYDVPTAWAGMDVSVAVEACCEAKSSNAIALFDFDRGDCNQDGNFNIADAVFLLGNLFPPPSGMPNMLVCRNACDGNDDGALNIADAVALLAALFPPPGGPPVGLPSPFGACGADPTPSLDCLSSVCP